MWKSWCEVLTGELGLEVLQMCLQQCHARAEPRPRPPSSTTARPSVHPGYFMHRQGAPASQVEIMDVAWDEGAGTQLLESLLLRHFMAQAGEALGEAGADLAASPRAVAKLRAGVKRALRVLSANLEAPLSVEELHAGRDFRSSISREALERLAGDYWARVTRPALDLLARNGVAAADLAAVELLGGGSRIPRVKAELSQALGGRALDV